MAAELTLDRIRASLPDRPVDGHKGTFGHLFVLAGSRGFTGAAKLACEGALRSGVGLVTLGVPRPLGDVVAASLTEAMSFMLPATVEETLAKAAAQPALDFAADKQAVVLGPGISQQAGARDFTLEFVPNCPAPIVIDADGLNCLSADPEVLNRMDSPFILTPHPGEMARLAGLDSKQVQADREVIARDLAARYGCTVVLKGHGTLIANEADDCFVNTTGNSGLASGGTGDVLSGFIGGLLAQGMSAFDAALAGVYLHGMAGDLASAARTERGMVAGDVVDQLPEAWRRLEGA